MRLLILTFISFMLFLQQGFAAVKIEGVRVWPAPDHTRIVFDVSARVEHNIFTLQNPGRLVIDISDVAANPRLEALKLPPPNLSNVCVMHRVMAVTCVWCWI